MLGGAILAQVLLDLSKPPLRLTWLSPDTMQIAQACPQQAEGRTFERGAKAYTDRHKDDIGTVLISDCCHPLCQQRRFASPGLFHQQRIGLPRSCQPTVELSQL